jgi:hypothetical protein
VYLTLKSSFEKKYPFSKKKKIESVFKCLKNGQKCTFEKSLKVNKKRYLTWSLFGSVFKDRVFKLKKKKKKWQKFHF